MLRTFNRGQEPFHQTVPLDKLTGIMSAAAVEEKRNAGLLIESEKGVSFYVADMPTQPEEPTEEPTAAAEIEEPAADVAEAEQACPETTLRALWTAQCVTQEEQNRLIAGETEKAKPGAEVGLFRLPDQEPVKAPPCAACTRPWSAHATHPATTCGYYWTADEWAKEQACVIVSNTASQIEAMRQTLRAGVSIVTAPQLFPTPVPLAARMAELAEVEPGQEVLEPSAGTGILIDAIKTAQPDARVYAVEINHQLCEMLSQKINIPTDAAQGLCRNVLQGDFLECFGLGRFDRIVMNPPFGDGDDIKHITHALRLLNPGGRIVALCANGPRQTAKLRPIIEEMGGEWEELPTDTFAAAGTSVRTVLMSASAR